jgi:hypothetical protein
MHLIDDFYYKEDYASLYCTEKYSTAIHKFEYEKGEFSFSHLGIKRIIEKIGNASLSEPYYDSQTPYGYGGMRINTNNLEFINESFDAYKKYCFEQNIIAEFFTFHPFLPFFESYSSQFDFLKRDREIVIVDISLSREERWSLYASNTRNILRNCEKLLKFTVSANLETFRQLYRSTMEKNQASNFYFFDDLYFEKLYNIEDCSLVAVEYSGSPISMAFLFHSGEIAHYHLSANDYKFSKLNGNYFLLDQSINYLSSIGCNKFLLGGGRTNAQDDSLFRFKQKFSPNRAPFYIGGLIFNDSKYLELCKLWQQIYLDRTNNYFLKYRL